MIRKDTIIDLLCQTCCTLELYAIYLVIIFFNGSRNIDTNINTLDYYDYFLIDFYKMLTNPLVSVVVITYNSYNTILETLDSIAAQTYQNIELIVSDDCSKDDTVKVVKKWLGEHRDRFERTELLTVDVNTGTAGNLNRGYAKSRGIWIKSIAGDDKLIPTCINSNIEYIRKNPDVEILLSKVKMVGAQEHVNKFKNIFIYGALELSNTSLLYLLLTGNFLPAPTLFISSRAFNEIGEFEESMPLLEDWPFWIKALYHKKSISFNNEYTVYYRVSDSSVSLSTNPNPLYLNSIKIFNDYFLPQYQWKINKFIWLYSRCNKLRSNKSGILKYLFLLMIYINPFTYQKKYLYSKAYRLNAKYMI